MANLAGAKLQHAHFSNADLSFANLFGATLLQTGFNQTILDSAVVGNYQWLNQLSATGQDSIRGINYLMTHYKVDSVQRNRRYQFLLLKKGK